MVSPPNHLLQCSTTMTLINKIKQKTIEDKTERRFKLEIQKVAAPKFNQPQYSCTTLLKKDYVLAAMIVIIISYLNFTDTELSQRFLKKCILWVIAKICFFSFIRLETL